MTDEEIKAQEEEKKILADDQHDNDQDDDKDEDDKVDWKSEALKHKAIADRLKGKLSKVAPITKSNDEPKIDDELVKDVKVLKEEREKRQFGFDHNLSPEETDQAFKMFGKPTKENLEDPFFKAGLEGLRSKKRLEANLPGSSSRSSVFNEKSFAELDEAGRKAAFESKMKGIRK